MDKSNSNIHRLHARVVSKYSRTAAKYFFRRLAPLKITKPIISFSFDDFPLTALNNGGDILNAYGVKATFYVSLGRLGNDSPSGVIASQSDIHRALKEGHEVGCHTYNHVNSYKTKTEAFVQSVLKNRETLFSLFPETDFSSFAYPICQPRLSTKRRIGKLFLCCRGGGQTINVGSIDLNLLRAFFLDNRSENRIDTIKQLIDKNAEERGWLIFASHDIDSNPSRYGCSNKMFLGVVKHAMQSGAVLVPVRKACDQVLRDKYQDYRRG